MSYVDVTNKEIVTPFKKKNTDQDQFTDGHFKNLILQSRKTFDDQEKILKEQKNFELETQFYKKVDDLYYALNTKPPIEKEESDSSLNYSQIISQFYQQKITTLEESQNKLEEAQFVLIHSIQKMNPHQNFFLSESAPIQLETKPGKEFHTDNQNTQQIWNFGNIQTNSQNHLHKNEQISNLLAYTQELCYSEGKEFFFLPKGSLVTIKHIYEDEIFVDVEFDRKIGLFNQQYFKVIKPKSPTHKESNRPQSEILKMLEVYNNNTNI